jgi:vesicle transport protein SEC22
MRQNIHEVLIRGEKIGHVSEISTNLADRSKEFKWGAIKINFQAHINTALLQP